MWLFTYPNEEKGLAANKNFAIKAFLVKLNILHHFKIKRIRSTRGKKNLEMNIPN